MIYHRDENWASEDNYIRQIILDIFLKYRSTMKVNNSVNSLISFFRWQRFEKWREIQISLEFRASEDNYIRQMILDIFLKYRSTMKINNSVNSVVFFFSLAMLRKMARNSNLARYKIIIFKK